MYHNPRRAALTRQAIEPQAIALLKKTADRSFIWQGARFYRKKGDRI
ncbi:MAG: hypothetical protein HC941_12480 [Microcoleus sp. SU_5_3]|nr:hypothetical protein [Microcoleus sp. SU_5_3]